MTTAAALASVLTPIRRRHYRSPEARWKAVLAEVRPIWDRATLGERAEITDELDALYRELGGTVEGGAAPPPAVAPRHVSLRPLLMSYNAGPIAPVCEKHGAVKFTQEGACPKCWAEWAAEQNARQTDG